MNETTYIVVGLDQKEKNITLETIKDLYSKRLLHDDSLVISPETGKWQTLAKTFNLSEFPARVYFRQSVNNQMPPLHQQPFVNQGGYQSGQTNYSPDTSYTNFHPQPNYYQNQSNYQSGNYSYQSAPYHNPQKTSSGKGFLIALIVLISVAAIGVTTYLGIFKALKLNSDRAFLKEINKLEIPGKEYVDAQTGVKISIPNNWRMIKAPNHLIDAPDAKMLATDKNANRSVMLEIVTLPSHENGQKLIYPPDVLDQVIPKLEQMLKEESQTYKTISIDAVPVQGLVAKKITYERSNKPSKTKPFSMYDGDLLIKGQISFIKKENTIFILQIWTLKEDYTNAINVFMGIEKNFVIPQ